MELSLFKGLEVILRNYSQQSPRKLLDNYLRIRILLRVSSPVFQELAARIQLPAAERAVFDKHGKTGRNRQTVCVVIDHPLGLPLADPLLATVDECIVVSPDGQDNNILRSNPHAEEAPTRAVLFHMCETELVEVREQLEAYLSVCEVFFGHLHLVVCCYETDSTTFLANEIAPTEGDEFADFRENSYFRVL
jgi:hypothetical protein